MESIGSLKIIIIGIFIVLLIAYCICAIAPSFFSFKPGNPGKKAARK